MRRSPLYTFENLDSTGIYNVPIDSTVQINDADGFGTPMTIQIENKSFVNPSTTIREFISYSENYSIPGSTEFISKNDVGTPGGVAPLNSEGKLPFNMVERVVVGNTYVVSSEQEMVDLDAEKGDIAIRTDTNEAYINNGNETGTINDWVKLEMPQTNVTSVNGQTGVVLLTTDDISEGINNAYFTIERFQQQLKSSNISELFDVNDNASIGAVPGQALIWNGSQWAAMDIPYPIETVNGKTGRDIVLNTDDIPEGSNKFYQDALVDNRIQLTIDDNAGAGETSKLWSADKIATELTTKVSNENPIFLGYVQIQRDVNGDSALKVQGSLNAPTNVQGTIQSNAFYFRDIIARKSFGLLWDDENSKIDFVMDNTTSLSIEKDRAPYTNYQPMENEDLTRKDYVDSSLDIKFDKAGGTINGDVEIIGNLNVKESGKIIDFQGANTKLGYVGSDVEFALNVQINQDLLVGGQITAGADVQVGVGVSGSSIVAFTDTDDQNKKPGIYWSNTDKIFKITDDLMDANIPSNEIWHAGNFNPGDKMDKASGTTAERPTNVEIGFMYFDTDLNKPIWMGNSGWVDAIGNAV